jgi:CRP-like cAMP-binding protein
VIKMPRFAEVEEYRDGDIIVRDGDEDRHMYVIQQGKVAVTTDVGGHEVTLAILERGSFFGEMALLESLPRTANVRALGAAKLLVIRPGSLLMRIRRDPTLALEMLQQMSRRIRAIDERLVELLSDVGVPEHQANEIKMFASHPEYGGPLSSNPAAERTASVTGDTAATGRIEDPVAPVAG